MAPDPIRLTSHELALLSDLDAGFYVTSPEDKAWTRLVDAGFVELCPPPSPALRITALGSRQIRRQRDERAR